MVLVWIILGIIGWILPIIPILWRMKHKLLSKGKKSTLGNIYNEFDPDEITFAFIPVINLFLAIVYLVDGLFTKYRDVEL